MSRSHVLAAFFGLGLLLAAAPAARAETAAAPDSSLIAAPAPGREIRLRGTVEPIPRHFSRSRRVIRNIGYIPYTALELVARPVVALVRTNEIYKITRRLTRVLIWDVDPVDSRLAARFGWESGFGMTIIGVNVSARDWFGSGLDYGLTAGYLNPRNNLLSLKFSRETERGEFSLISRWEHKDDRPFYGLGPDSRDIRYNAHRMRLLNELSWRHSLGRIGTLALTGYVRQTDLDVPKPDDDDLRVADGFPGLFNQAESSRYRGLEAGLTHDSRNDGEFSTRGELSHMLLGYNAGTSHGDASYVHYSLEVQRFKPLFRENRSLVTRIFLEGLLTDYPDHLPYTEMGNLGGRDCLRGFSRDRFTDTHSALLTLEYRYPVTSRVQGRIFSDWGAVGPAWREFKLNDFAWSAGMALAIRVEDTPVTAQIAGSRDGVQAFLGTTLMFSMKSRRLR